MNGTRSSSSSVGDDDANVGGPGECPGHEFELLEVVPVEVKDSLFGALGLAQVHECKWCGAQQYEPSNFEL